MSGRTEGFPGARDFGGEEVESRRGKKRRKAGGRIANSGREGQANRVDRFDDQDEAGARSATPTNSS